MTATLEEVIEAAGTSVVPDSSAKTATEGVAEKVLSKVEKAAAQHPEVVGVLLGGSFAKDTWLPGDVDIDVFVKVSPDVGEEKFEEVGLSVGREALRGYKPGKKYAQHPYTEATVEGFKVNVVPCYDVSPGEWRSAADRSVYHVTFVREHLDADARLQVRLLKRFMKAVGVYGAEIEKEGFSGYATEVLVHEHASFEATLRWFALYSPASAREARAYFSLFDPVDEARDLGKAVSKETVARMVVASRAFLESPSLQFFKRLRGKARPSLQKRALAIAFEHKELSEDTLWGELKRSARQIAKHVREEGFTLARIEAASDNLNESAIILLPVVETLPEIEERLGPGVELLEGAKAFVAKNRATAKMVWVGEDGRLRMLAGRRFTSLTKLLEDALRSKAAGIGVAKEVGRALKENGRVLQGEGLRREAAKKPWLREALARVASDSVGL